MIYIGTTIEKQIGDRYYKVDVTLSRLIAARHLVEGGDFHKALTGDEQWEETADNNRTNALKYMGEMGGLNLKGNWEGLSSMRRKMATAILSLSIGILLSGCGRREVAPYIISLTPESYKELKEDGQSAAIEEAEEGTGEEPHRCWEYVDFNVIEEKHEILEEEDSYGAELNSRYSCVVVEEGFEVTFFNSAHEIIFSECYPKEPAVSQVTDNIFEVCISVGSPAAYVFYIDVVNAEISETFFNPLFIGERYIAYMEDGELVLRDVFNEDLLCMTISRDFTKTANPMSAIIAIKMQDRNIITLSYYKGDNYEETSEIMTIP